MPLAPPAYAATFRVTRTDDPPPNGCQPNDCSLREAVLAANAAPGADTIIVPGGTYNLTIAGAGEDAAATGDLDLTGPVTINGAGRTLTTIDANDLDRAFDVLGGANATIQNLTVRDGAAPADGGCIRVAAGGTLTFSNAIAESCTATSGGGIEVSGTATVSNSIIRDNVASSDGGGIHTDSGSTLNVDNTTIDNNQSDNDGGGIETNSSATIRDSRITNNTSGSGGEGGGLEIDGPGTVTLENVLVSGNRAIGDLGGGIDVDDVAANVSLRNVTVRTNQADSAGGGVRVSNGTLTFSTGVVSGNTAGQDGGGIEVGEGTTATLSNVRIEGNTAVGEGGGIDNDGTLRLDNVRITGNTVGTGGGLDYTDDESTSSSNTTIVNNTPGNCDPASPCPP